jgi:hypothetical protein
MRTTASLIPRIGHAIPLLLLAINRRIAERMLGDIDPACNLETPSGHLFNSLPRLERKQSFRLSVSLWWNWPGDNQNALVTGTHKPLSEQQRGREVNFSNCCTADLPRKDSERIR